MEIITDIDKAILVMRDSGKWLKDSGQHVSKWWDLENLNKEFLLKYAKPEEFYVGLINNKPAAAEILQINQNGQDWEIVDKGNPPKALYIHWLAVAREFAGHDVSKEMIDFALQIAKENTCSVLRVDTNASETKLRKLYEKLGFVLVSVEKEDYRKTAFFEKKVS